MTASTNTDTYLPQAEIHMYLLSYNMLPYFIIMTLYFIIMTQFLEVLLSMLAIFNQSFSLLFCLFIYLTVPMQIKYISENITGLA